MARLTAMLRPAGGGLHVVSTGLKAQRTLQRAIYDAPSDDAVEPKWRAALSRLADARVALLGVPSDTGAGFTRGSNRAPAALRQHVLTHGPALPADLLDVGDVRVVPHLLEDAMLNAEQRAACRLALYGDADTDLPVSPLDLTRHALETMWVMAPTLTTLVVGGDHSVAWPAFAAAHAHWEGRGRRLGLLHFDAHTDLLEHRLGVKICFATWAWHANQLLGCDGRLVQVGVRTSGQTQAHWESTCNLRQIWAEEAMSRGPKAVAEEVVARFERLKVDALYVSHDIDAVDPVYAAATGTPEPGGLSPEFVLALTAEVAERFPLVGADLVEVAPPLSNALPGEPARTLQTASAFLLQFAERLQAPA